MQTIHQLKKYFCNSTTMLKIIAGIAILAIGSVIIYNQMLSIGEKKTITNFNLLQGCIKEIPTEQEEDKCFKKYPIDLRFVDLTITDPEVRIIQKYYANVGQQSWVIDYTKYLDERERASKNSQIKAEIKDLLLFIFFLVFIILVLYFIKRWSKSQSQTKKEGMIKDHEEENDCQCDDCIEQKNKN